MRMWGQVAASSKRASKSTFFFSVVDRSGVLAPGGPKWPREAPWSIPKGSRSTRRKHYENIVLCILAVLKNVFLESETSVFKKDIQTQTVQNVYKMR